MSIHKPKLISSTEGLGANTTKTIDYVTDDIAIGTEIWNHLDEQWAEGDVIIAKTGYRWLTRWETGKLYVITKFFDASDDLVGIYCDITRPVKKTPDGFEFEDLYLDVWQIPGEKPVILDEDELSEALIAGFVSAAEADKAKKEAEKLVSALSQPLSSLTEF